MRSKCPVHQVRLADGHEAWLVVGHDAARQALRDTRFSKDFVAALGEDPEVVDAGLPGPAFARHMLAVDGDDHARLRQLVARAFAPTRIAALEPAIMRIVDELLDELAAAGPDAVVDLVEGFAHPLPFRVIGELFGIPVADQEAAVPMVPHALPAVERFAAARGGRRVRLDRRLPREPRSDTSGDPDATTWSACWWRRATTTSG